MMTIRRSLQALTLMLFAAVSTFAAPPDYKTPGKEWGKGPVKWIMTDDEEKDWKKLRADEERAAFVKSFWEKRDPTPGTPANEYEIIFWKKVEEADKTFKGEAQTAAGSMTDMGRVYLLLGPPTKPDKDARGRSIWIYEPNEALGIKQHLELIFAAGSQAPLLLDRKKLEEYVGSHPEARGIGWKIPAPQAAEALPDSQSVTRKAEEDLTPESKRQIPILEDLLAKGSGRTDVPFQVGLDSYAAADGTTLTVVTVETPREAAHGSGDAALHPFARIQPAGEGKPVNLTGDLPFVPAPTGESPVASYCYQARQNLQPGRYKLAVVVEDKVVPGQMGTLVRMIEVPDYRGADLNMSSVALLAGFTHLDPGQDPDEKAHAGPYVLGSFRLVPRASASLAKNEAISFYYQVYHPATDPASGRPSLESTVTFFLKEAQGWKRYRPPVVRKLAGQVDLYSIDLKDLLAPTQALPADFKMEMKLVDSIGGKELNREILFTVR